MEKPYVFVSYAHKNSHNVMPAIAQLKAQGVCLWYDDGIEAGSEWPEFVAERVMNCTKFVLFISEAYLESQNCKRELNFAISQKKEVLSVFIEEVKLSPGMEMQLGTYQALFRNRFPDTESFCAALARAPFFNSCRTVTQPAPESPRPAAAKVENKFTNTATSNQQTVTQPAPATPRPATAKEENKFTNTATSNQQTATATTETMLPKKNKWVAALLAFFLGSFGVHKFYLGQKKWGIAYLVCCWTRVPGVLGMVEAIIIMIQSKEKFAQKYNCRIK